MPDAQYEHSLVGDGTNLPLALLEIHHSYLTQPVRVVNDNQDLTHNGELYRRIAFRVALPPKYPDRSARATIQVDRYNDEIVKWIEESKGGRDATVILKMVTRAAPDTVGLQITLEVKGIVITATSIDIELGFSYNFSLPFMQWSFTPETAPGLFA